jgi:hypothetical protein
MGAMEVQPAAAPPPRRARPAPANAAAPPGGMGAGLRPVPLSLPFTVDTWAPGVTDKVQFVTHGAAAAIPAGGAAAMGARAAGAAPVPAGPTRRRPPRLRPCRCARPPPGPPAHKDHTVGIAECAAHICATPTTLALLRIKHPALARRLDAGAVRFTPLPEGHTLHLVAAERHGGYPYCVTSLPYANHCPGAANTRGAEAAAANAALPARRMRVIRAPRILPPALRRPRLNPSLP